MLTEYLYIQKITAQDLLKLPKIQQAAFFHQFAEWRLKKLRRQEQNLLLLLAHIRCAIELNENQRCNQDLHLEHSA